MRPSELPAPDADAAAASARLSARIAREIARAGGWISFARYMARALYEPGLGYYAAGAVRFGAGGDFVTAPELSPLFARALARQVAELLAPGEAVLEFGAGSGALAETLLEELARLGRRPAYAIVETSAALRARQRARLGERVRWLARPPARFRGVVIANEVLDAMPVHALAWTAAGIFERGVTVRAGRFAWAERPAEGEPLAAARAIDVELSSSGRYESEIGLAARAWVRAVGARLERGAILVLDYGFPAREYYHPQRSTGTLLCYYRHRVHDDPFHSPGLQDITAHLDFSALARAGRDVGLEALGYASQAQFLVNCGIAELLAAEDPADARRYLPAAAAVQKLLSPAEMGELVKVLALGRGVAAPLLGFARGDRSHAL
ncbi:MAG: SAM-dependent methyltransferase [Burkholderiales bacterium]|nr:SAM-dependent methyltransferase [Burkholderiales bacterium]